MSTESIINLNQLVKKVEFFPYNWSSNLLAIILKDSIKIYIYNNDNNNIINNVSNNYINDNNKRQVVILFIFILKTMKSTLIYINRIH
jgi:hypothetical protein